MPADGSDEALPCRPTIACTAYIAPPGDVELEMGYLFRRLEHGSPQHTTPFLLKLSIATWVQLQVSSNGYTVTNSPPLSHYFDDVAVGAKLHAIDQYNYFPSLSFSVLLNLPTPPQRGYARGYDGLLTAYITEKFGRFEVDLNVGVNIWRTALSIVVQPWAAFAMSYGLPRSFVVMVETYYFADAQPVVGRDGGTLFALSYTPRSWIVFDTGVDAGWFSSERSVSAFVGATLIVGNLWAPKRRPQ